jgi:hypothetical protein
MHLQLSQLLLFFFLFPGFTFSQNCRTPMVDQLFQPKFNKVKEQPDDELKFDIATYALTNNCFTSLQIKYFTRLFIQDNIRYDFAKLAYSHCTDTENYYDVLDAFKNYGYAFRLYDFINNEKKRASIAAETLQAPNPPPCRVSDGDFTIAKTNIINESISSTQLSIAREVVRAKKCFTCMQIKELTKLLSIESYKLDFVKFSYDFTIDKENFYIISDAFSASSSKNQLLDFIASKR